MKKKASWWKRLRSSLLRRPENRDELIEVLNNASEEKLLNHQALNMIEGVLDVSILQVRDIMIPRAKIVTVKEQDALTQSLKVIINSGHSRFPVLSTNPEKEEVIGVLHAKDLLPYKFKLTDKEFNLRKIMRSAVLVPESKRLDKLLQDFRKNRYHMAIVVNEYGGISGLITIEDVLEQIVGEIEDEFDTEDDAAIKQINDGVYLIKALTPIQDVNTYFHSQFDEEQFDTLGGFVVNKLGYLPKRGETITIDDYQFKILHADTRRVQLLEMRTLSSQQPH